MTTTYADGSPLLSADAGYLAQFEDGAAMLQRKADRTGLLCDQTDATIAATQAKRIRLDICGVDCPAGCDAGYMRTEDNLQYGECATCYGHGRVMPDRAAKFNEGDGYG